MASDGRVEFDIVANTQQVQQSLNQTTQMIEQSGKKWERSVNESSENMGEALNRAFDINRIKDYAIKAGQAIAQFAGDAIQSVSALREVQNVVDVTFGANANEIETWAKKARSQFGLTETQAKQFTSTLGAMAKSAGITGPEIVGMSTDLAGLAADMASFYNMDFETAFQKIRSGISGETEPLKQLGVNMSVANLQAYAMTQGITKAFDKMSQSEQVMLRYQYLMQATADAQGDFARTSDGFANAQRRFETALDTIKTSVGSFLLEVVEPATSGLANFLGQLTTPTEQTIFDTFSNIESTGASKIAEIEQTAAKASALVDTLEKLDGTKAKKALKDVSEGAKSLPAATPENWQTLYSALQGYTNLSALTGKGEEESHRWLADLAADAKELSPEDAQAWETLFSTLKEGLPGLNSEEGQKLLGSISTAFADGGGAAVSALKINTQELEKYLHGLGITVDDTTDGQKVWLDICKQLVETIPGLSSIINTETGEIEGGTQAVRDYIAAWKDYNTAEVLYNVHKQKGEALQKEFSDIGELEYKLIGLEAKTREAREKFNQLGGQARMDQIISLNPMAEFWGQGHDAYIELKRLQEEISSTGYYETQRKLTERQTAYNQAVEQYIKDGDALKEKVGDYEESQKKAAKATEETTKAMTEQVKAASSDEAALKKIKEQVKTTASAFNDLAEYIKKTRDGIMDTLTGNSGGLFEEITTPWEEALKKQAEIKDKLLKETDKNGKLKYNSKEAGDLAFKQSGSDAAVKSVTGMLAGLKDQQRYMEEYLQLIEQARTLGLDENLLAQLSDGSTTSFDYLTAIAKGNKESIDQINQAYKSVSDAKNKLADNLTGNKLSVDETYQNLQDKANAALETLQGMTVPAGQAATDTVSAIVQALADGLPGVDTGVQNILTSLAQLTSFGGVGLSIGGGSGGYFSFSSAAQGAIAVGSSAGIRSAKPIGSNAMGLDFVPFDGYLSQLHEGEGILTAEENRVWQQFKNGMTSNVNAMDYDTLGNVMRDNVHAGGNVYLDGVTVGRVVSGRQADSYRALERSGWQK